MNAKESELYERRLERLKVLKLPHYEAITLAVGMYHRDKDPEDDRNLCLECRWLQDETCNKVMGGNRKLQPVRFMLWRCDYFNKIVREKK